MTTKKAALLCWFDQLDIASGMLHIIHTIGGLSRRFDREGASEIIFCFDYFNQKPQTYQSKSLSLNN
jgi:hypothetical protein